MKPRSLNGIKRWAKFRSLRELHDLPGRFSTFTMAHEELEARSRIHT